jgi:hypothetical protein
MAKLLPTANRGDNAPGVVAQPNCAPCAARECD